MMFLFALMGAVGMVATVLFLVHLQGKKSERLENNESTIKKVSKAKNVAATTNRDSNVVIFSELFTRWKRK